MYPQLKIRHLLIAKVQKRIWPVKRPLATAVKGERLQNEMLPRLPGDLATSKEKQS